MFAAFGLLLAAIALEVLATSALPRTDGFREPLWSGLVIGGYAASIWLLALVVEHLPVSTAYAVWSGVGTAAVAFIGAMWLGGVVGPGQDLRALDDRDRSRLAQRPGRTLTH